MLIVTDFAAAAIQHLLERSNAPDDAGLRIARAATRTSLKVQLKRAPSPDDTVVVAANGARVFLDEWAAGLLDQKILDVTLGAGGRVEFFATNAREPIEPRY
jgi:iron-sulfur cluster assembly protein